MTMTLTLQEAADFSAIAYQPLSTPLSSVYTNDGWIALDPQNYDYGTNGYFGRAFVKLDNGTPTELVIAHRGTEPTDSGDLLADLQLSLGVVCKKHHFWLF